MKKLELLIYTQNILDIVSKYFQHTVSKEQMDAAIADEINRHLGKSWIKKTLETLKLV